MKMIKEIFVLIILVASLQSCKERIDFDLNNEDFKRVVVEGFITDQVMAHEVRLSFTSSYFENNAPEMVSGATVSITDGVDTWALTEASAGIYNTADDVSGTIGRTHTLRIEYDGEVYEASDYLGDVAALDSIKVTLDEDLLETTGDSIYAIAISTTETAGVGDFYRWRIFVNGVTSNDTLENFEWADDVLYDGATLVEEDFFWEDNIHPGDTVQLDQMSITELANNIFVALNLETNWRGGLFDAAPSNVPTNVSNGALGFFGASTVSSKTVIVE